MPPAYLPVPTTHAEASSAWIRGVLAAAREDFGRDVLDAVGGLTDETLASLIPLAEKFAARILDACGFPEAAGEIQDLAAREREAEPGGDVPA